MATSGGLLLYYHTPHAIGMTPFKALYGYEALNSADLVFEDSRAPKAKDWVQEGQDILKVLEKTYKHLKTNRSYMQTNIELRVVLR